MNRKDLSRRDVTKKTISFSKFKCSSVLTSTSVCCSGGGDYLGLAGRVREEGQHDIADLLCQRALLAALQRVRAVVSSPLVTLYYLFWIQSHGGTIDMGD